MTGRSADATGRPKKRWLRRRRKALLLIVAVLFVLTALYVKGIVGVPGSESGYVCAVCGREKTMRCPFGIQHKWTEESPATKYCDRFVGKHEHVWLLGYRRYLLSIADGVGKWEVPICSVGVADSLAALGASPYLERAVRSLCDVDNYYAWLAEAALTRRPPDPEHLDEWWQENEGWFEVQHEAERALEVLDQIFQYPEIEHADEEFYDFWDAALKTQWSIEHFGAPTPGGAVRGSE